MFKLNSGIKWRNEREEKVLLNNFMVMNRTAGEILELCKSAHNVEDLSKALNQRHPEIPYNRIRSDVERFTDRLLIWNILISDDSQDDSTHFAYAPVCVEHILGHLQNKLVAPMGVACELTSSCNAKCLHCCIPSTSTMPPNEFSTLEWKGLIDQMVAMGVFRISFTGGEPLLRDDLEELAHYSGIRGLDSSVATNAFLLNEERINRLISAGVASFMISLDGADPEVHDKFRGLPGLFERVVGVFSVLVRKRINVGVVTIVTKMNLEQIPDIMQLMEDTGIRRLSLANLRRAGRGAKNTFLEPSVDDYTRLIAKIWEKEKQLKNLKIKYPNLPAAFFKESIGLEKYEELKRIGKVGYCGAAITGCAISSTGDVKPCDMSGGVSAGNVRVQRLSDIWRNSPLFNHLRQLRKEETIPCKKCNLLNACLPGCRAQPYQVELGQKSYVADATRVQCFEKFAHVLTGNIENS